MNLAEIDLDDYVIFLKFKKNLPKEYFLLSALFSECNLKLIPVAPEDLAKIGNKGKRFLLAFIPDIQTYNLYMDARFKYLEHAIRNKRHYVFEASSFVDRNFINRLRLIKTYKHYLLPIEAEEIVKDVAQTYMMEQEQADNWPGGNRARLSLSSNAKL